MLMKLYCWVHLNTRPKIIYYEPIAQKGCHDERWGCQKHHQAEHNRTRLCNWCFPLVLQLRIITGRPEGLLWFFSTFNEKVRMKLWHIQHIIRELHLVESVTAAFKSLKSKEIETRGTHCGCAFITGSVMMYALLQRSLFSVSTKKHVQTACSAHARSHLACRWYTGPSHKVVWNTNVSKH